jgi:hypothetical protein
MRTVKREKLVPVFVALVLTSPLTIAFIGWFVWCDWVPDATIARLPNATRAEVRELLGEPDSPPMVDQEQAECWCYRRPCRVAEFQVYFDSDGRVKEWWYDR